MQNPQPKLLHVLGALEKELNNYLKTYLFALQKTKDWKICTQLWIAEADLLKI